MNEVKNDDIWSPFSFRIAEIIIGLMLTINGTYLFITNLSAILQETSYFYGSIIFLISLAIYAAPVFIGFVIINAGTFGKDPAIIARKNLKIFLFLILIFSLIASIGYSIIEIAPPGLKMDQEISFGDLFTPIAIIISLATISYGWLKDQQQRKKEYADRIRSAAGTIVAMMARRNSLNERFFESIQPLLLDSISMIIKNGESEQAREFLWKEIVKEGMNTTQRRLEEPLEEAFKDLYGYDSKLQRAFTDTMYKLTRIEDYIYMVALLLFQIEINGVCIRPMPCERKLERAQLVKIFDWNKVPGDDSQNLIEFLRDSFRIEWIKQETIKKTDGKMIKASTENNSFSMELSDKKNEAVLEIDGDRRNVFLAKMENEGLNIYGIKSEYVHISKEDLVTDLRKTASMLSYEQKYLVDAVIFSFIEPLRNLINSDDDQIFNKRIDLSMPPLTESWKSALEELKLCTQGKFLEAVKFYDQALEKENTVAGFWAGKSLAHLGGLDVMGWDATKQKAIETMYNK